MAGGFNSEIVVDSGSITGHFELGVGTTTAVFLTNNGFTAGNLLLSSNYSGITSSGDLLGHFASTGCGGTLSDTGTIGDHIGGSHGLSTTIGVDFLLQRAPSRRRSR